MNAKKNMEKKYKEVLKQQVNQKKFIELQTCRFDESGSVKKRVALREAIPEKTPFNRHCPNWWETPLQKLNFPEINVY